MKDQKLRMVAREVIRPTFKYHHGYNDKSKLKKWQPTPVLLPGKSHGQRSLVGYSPWGCKELDMTE